MRGPLLIALVVLSGFLSLPAASTQDTKPAFDPSHALWNDVLKTCVRGDGVDYAKLKQDSSKLQAYLGLLHAVTPEELAGWSEPQRFAFWINAYNAHAVHKVIEHYPLASIRKLDGAFGITTVFEKAFIPMEAHHPDGKPEKLSLDDIEHRILRPGFHDARVHAAVNCASKSCPPLRGEAFVAERLSAQLDEQMKGFVADARRNRIDPAKKELAVSELFKWFAEDFERDAKSVKEYLVRFAPPEQAEFIRSAKLRYLDYDWDLNDASGR